MNFRNEDGISENISVMLIIAVAVMGIAIIGVTVTSQDTPDEVPNVDMIIGCDQSPVNSSEYNITLFHNGGDTLSTGDFVVQALAEDGSELHVSDCTESSGNCWAIGDTATYFADGKPVSIRILYTAGSAGAMLKSLNLGMPDDEEEVPPDVFVDETSTPTPTPTPTPTLGVDAGTVYFYREGNNHVTQSGYMKYRITATPSYVNGQNGNGNGNGGSFSYDLVSGDTLCLNIGSGSQGNSKYFIIEGMGTFATLDGGKVSIEITGSHPYSDSGKNVLARLTGYEVTESTYTIKSDTTGQGQYTLLIIGEDAIINEDNNEEEIRIVNARPVPGSVSILDTSSRGRWGETRFIGEADEVWRGSVKVYPDS